MKVHFGGSISGLRKNPKRYKAIRQTILLLGHQLTRDWIDIEMKGNEKLSASEIYDLTEKAIKEADAVILEYSENSSAPGKQMLIALESGIPVLLLSTNSVSQNGFFVGTKHEDLVKKSRYSLTSLRGILEKYLVWVESNSRTSRFNLVLDKKLDNYLKVKAKTNKSSKTEEIRRLIIEDMERTKAN